MIKLRRDINQNDCMWQAIYTATTAEYPASLTGKERELAVQTRTKEEYRKLLHKYNLR